MTREEPSARVEIASFLNELSSLLHQCAENSRIVEEAVINWLHAAGEPTSFPVHEFQRIDLVQQLQNDVARILRSDVLLNASSGSLDALQFHDLLNQAILQHTKDRLVGKSEDLQPDPPNSGSASGSQSHVDLF